MKTDSEVLEVLQIMQEAILRNKESVEPIDEKSLISDKPWEKLELNQKKTSWDRTEVISNEYDSEYGFKPQKKVGVIGLGPQVDLSLKKLSEEIQHLHYKNQKLLEENGQLHEKNIELNKKNQYLQGNPQKLVEKNQLNKKLEKKDQQLNFGQLLLERKESHPYLNQEELSKTVNKVAKFIQKILAQRELEKTKMNQTRQQREEYQKELLSFEQNEPLSQAMSKRHTELLTLNNQQLSEENQYLNQNNQFLEEENNKLRKFILENLPLSKVYLKEENHRLQEENEQLHSENRQLQKAVKEGTTLIKTLTSELEQVRKTTNVIDSQEVQSNLTQLKKDNRRLMKWLGYESEKLMQLEKTDVIKKDPDPDSSSDNNNSPQP